MGMVRSGRLRAARAALIIVGAFFLGAAFTAQLEREAQMDLGNFSVSLSVEDLAASKTFYGHLGFEVIAGKEEENWLILRNGDAKIGIFQGQFEGNLLTFNPPDVRSIQQSLKGEGIEFILEAKEGEGPAHAVLQDPDGNVILIDQHEG